MKRQANSVWILLAFALVSCQTSKPPAQQQEARGASSSVRNAAPAPTASSEWLKAVTAKSYLAKAREMANRWQADSELYGVSASFALPDGTASPKVEWGYEPAWEYLFYSRKVNQVFKVDVTEKGLVTKEDVPMFPPEAMKPLADNFVDSDRAMEVGKIAGWKLVPQNMMQLGCVANQNPQWNIQSGNEKHYVDATSGKAIM